MANERKLEISFGGLSLTTILFLIFLVLKLTGYITWSWWWVTAPLWMPAAAGIGIILFILLFMLIVALIAALFRLF